MKNKLKKIIILIFVIVAACTISCSSKNKAKPRIDTIVEAVYALSKEDVRVTLKTQTIVRNYTSFTIILIVAFGIYNILNMVVNQKKREIAILRSIGYNQRETIFLFMVQGVILGMGGAIFGVLPGLVSCYYIEKIQIGTGLGHMPMSWGIANSWP